MLPRRVGALTSSLLVTTLLGCADPQGADGCLGDVELSVVRGTSPTFSWLPECGLSNLAVLDAANQSVWGIHGPVGENVIAPPVTFGVVPDGAQRDGAPGELRPGYGYVLRVFRLRRIAAGEFEVLQVGETNFRW